MQHSPRFHPPTKTLKLTSGSQLPVPNCYVLSALFSKYAQFDAETDLNMSISKEKIRICWTLQYQKT